MRNKYPGPCYLCRGHVPQSAGYFECHGGAWRVRHEECTKKERVIKKMENAVYAHYKTGGLYEMLIDRATLENGLRPAVVYRSLSDNRVWVREAGDFFATVQYNGADVPRFSLCK